MQVSRRIGMNTSKKQIQLVPYDSNWPGQFELEAAKIKSVLGNNLVAIHHIGSTSVPDLDAKATIDIISVVQNGADTITSLEELGYIYKGEWNIPFKYGFTYRGEIKVNLHVLEENHPEIQSNILFRDYLRNNSEARCAYAKLKYKILEDPSASEKSQLFFYNYTLKKGDFIRDILKKAGFNSLRMLKMSDESERLAALTYQQEYLRENPNNEALYLDNLDSNDHQHFILYKGVEIIGYAQVQLWYQDGENPIRAVIIDKTQHGQGYDNWFLQMLEKWVKNYLRSNVAELHS